MPGWKDAVEIGKWAWDNRAAVTPALTAFRRWLRKSKILIIGPGGTGKTTLARMLSGQFDWLLDSPWRYDEDVGVQRFKLKDDPAAEIVVMPGQARHRGSTWKGVGEDLATGTYHGVIFVSAYGCHSLSENSYQLHELYEPERNKGVFWEKYLGAKRGDEIECLKQLLPFMKTCPRKLWFASVVTKQDLWHSRENAVRRWYREGDYGKLIVEVENANAATFHHHFHPVSLVIRKFVTDKNEVLAKNIAGYDQQAQLESVRRLFEVINDLRKWGSEK